MLHCRCRSALHWLAAACTLFQQVAALTRAARAIPAPRSLLPVSPRPLLACLAPFLLLSTAAPPAVSPACLATKQGLKTQNRAVEGDEVAIRILPPSEWYQLASAKAAAEAEAAKAAAASSPETTAGLVPASRALGRSNVVPATLPSRAAAAGAPPPTPLTAAVGAAPAAMTPPVWADGEQRRPTGDLVASPALLPSGGCLQEPASMQGRLHVTCWHAACCLRRMQRRRPAAGSSSARRYI